MKNLVLSILGVFLICSCANNTSSKQIALAADYDEYLKETTRTTLNEVEYQKGFWSQRLNQDTTGIGDIGPLGNSYEALFGLTGEIAYLREAEQLYLKGLENAAVQYKDGFERSLAKNYISQHRFKEADSLLKLSFANVSDKSATKQMMFDTAMELGNYEEAYQLLVELKDMSDYNYLIRVSKWSDHQGNLEAAIKYLEMAKDIAESKSSKALLIWTYSNLADYYGHAGKIDISYQYNLKTLELDPDNIHVLKSLAWIAFSADHDIAEAHRIIDSLMEVNQSPDLILMKSELLDYEGKSEEAKKMQNQFLEKASQPAYGNMYNTYLIDLLGSSNPEKALSMARKEVELRATPESYQWLAYALLMNGDENQALEVMHAQVIGKTFEPMALYHEALVYKGLGDTKKVQELKLELIDASYELGPLVMREINNL